MIFEDQYGVGDVVDLGEAIGTVEAVELRVTRLRDVNGTVWYVRNGEILRVGNQSQNWARTVARHPRRLPRGPRAGAPGARARSPTTCGRTRTSRAWSSRSPRCGASRRSPPTAVTVRVVLKTAPLQQWAVAREMRERIKARFDHEGIEIPLPQRSIWHRDDRRGRRRRCGSHRCRADSTDAGDRTGAS